jgi:hypothetical protein
LSTIDKALKAIADAETLKQTAIKELLTIIKEAEKRLAELGYNVTTTKVRTKKKTRNTDPAMKHCPICKMKGHDGRAHRGQGKTKKKFTAAELKALGL